ncbi:MAG: DUF4340 domain-containing protein [Bacteroidota bacterium]
MKKISNTTLLIIFVSLAIIALVFYYLDSRKGERTFRKDLFKVDSAKVTEITIHPKGNKPDVISLVKNGTSWDVKFKNKSYPADTSTVKRILHALTNIEVVRVSAADQSGWKSLEMTDSASNRVVVSQGTETVADLRVGKISFTRTQYQQYGGQNVDVKSNIRVKDDDRVYVVEGFLSMMFNDQLSVYRNHLVCRFDKNNLTKLTFLYPGDSSFQLVRSGAHWLLNNQPADSSKVESWLATMANCTGSEYADDKTPPVTYPYDLKIEGNNMMGIDIKGSHDPSTKFSFVSSSSNTAALFGGTSAYLFNQVFPSKSKFLPSREAPKKGKKK